MRYEEERLTAAVAELRAFSANITEKDTQADLGVIIAGFETLRPYVSVGLKVCASVETMDAINRLHQSGILKQELWNTLTNALELARKPNLPAPVQQAIGRPCRRVQSRILGRTSTLLRQQKNRLAY